MNRKNLILTLVAAFSLSLGSTAMAYNGNGYGNNSLPVEKQQLLSKIMTDSQTKMTPVMDQMWAKQTELRALSNNPNTKPEAINKLVSELSALRTQMRTEMTTRNNQIKSEIGIDPADCIASNATQSRRGHRGHGGGYGGGYGGGHGGCYF